MHLVPAPVPSLGLATKKCSWNDERNPARDHGRAEQPALRLRGCAPYQRAPDCGAVHAPRGLCSPIASEGGESVETCTSEPMAHDLVRHHRCCFAVWILFFPEFLPPRRRCCHPAATDCNRPASLPPFLLHTHSLNIYSKNKKQKSDRLLNLLLSKHQKCCFCRTVLKSAAPNCSKVQQSAALYFQNALGTWANFRTTDSRLAFYYESFRPD